MRPLNRASSRWGFFSPFYVTKRGHIYGLASARDHMRDGLATTLLGRYFPLPEYEGIVVEPGRRNIHPAENLILVGSASLFVDPGAHGSDGNGKNTPLAAKKLGARLRGIEKQCCYAFEGTKDRRIVNGVTGARYQPREDADSGYAEDYGVIRRVFRGPLENTIILEGVHRLGTLGATKVATSTISLDAIWDAVSRIPSFDESAPLEILVHTTFHDETHEGVFSLGEVHAVPLYVVYNRQWIFDLSDGHRWLDQMPWDMTRCVRGDGPAEDEPKADEIKLPRLEIEADLRELGPRVHRAARKVLGGDGAGANGEAPPPPTEEEGRLLLELLGETDRFRIVLVEKGPFGAQEKRVDLPQGRPSRIRTIRKQFFLYLAFCRLLGRGFVRDEEAIRRTFPRFEQGASRKPFASQFSGSVAGKMRDCFEPLLGTARHPSDLLRIDFAKNRSTYSMRLGTGTIVTKVRL